MYKIKQTKTPKVGDVAFKINDWREEYPFDIIEVVKCEGKFLSNERLKETYNIYHVFGLNKKEGFRKFRFSNGAFIDSIKIRKGSKKERELLKNLKLKYEN